MEFQNQRQKLIAKSGDIKLYKTRSGMIIIFPNNYTQEPSRLNDGSIWYDDPDLVPAPIKKAVEAEFAKDQDNLTAGEPTPREYEIASIEESVSKWSKTVLSKIEESYRPEVESYFTELNSIIKTINEDYFNEIEDEDTENLEQNPTEPEANNIQNQEPEQMNDDDDDELIVEADEIQSNRAKDLISDIYNSYEEMIIDDATTNSISYNNFKNDATDALVEEFGIDRNTADDLYQVVVSLDFNNFKFDDVFKEACKDKKFKEAIDQRLRTALKNSMGGVPDESKIDNIVETVVYTIFTTIPEAFTPENYQSISNMIVSKIDSKINEFKKYIQRG